MAQFPTYEMQYKVFRWTGMALNDFENRTQRILYNAYDVLLTISYVTFQMAFGYQLTVIAAGLTFQAMLLHAASFLICLGVLVKRLFVIGKKQQVKDLYRRLKKDFENPAIKDIKESDVIIQKFDDYYKRNNEILYLIGFITAVLFSLPTYMNFPEEIPFPIPFQEQLNWAQLFGITAWQSVLVWVGFINFLAYDGLVWGFLMLIATRLQLTANMWEHYADNYPSVDFRRYIPEYRDYPRQGVVTNRKYHSYDERMRHDENLAADTVKFLKKFIVYYQEITEEMAAVEKLFSFPLLVHMVGGAILIGIMIVFVIIGGLNGSFAVRTVSFFSCAVADLFLFSYYGTKIDEAKETLTSAVYSFPWHEGDNTTEKLFMYTMSMMRNKIQYTAGGFVPINFETYLSLMKLSYNLLAVLN